MKTHTKFRFVARARLGGEVLPLVVVYWCFGQMLLCAQSANLGPDAFGYRVTDDVPFSYEDISATGTRVLENQTYGSTNASIGFSFASYGELYSDVYISTLGLLTFVSPNEDEDNAEFARQSPYPNVPHIAAFWGDCPGPSGGIYYQTLCSPGNRRFVVQWKSVLPAPSSYGLDFEIIFYEGNNTILFQYQRVDTGDDRAFGAEATVGIRDTDGQANGLNLMWSYCTPVLRDNQAIRFEPPVVPFPPRLKTQPQSQTVLASEGAMFDATSVGKPPMAYQWFKDVSSVAGATNASLTVSNVQPDDAGSYWVMVSNAFGSATSSVALLVVIAEPVIEEGPASQSLAVGRTTTFSVTAVGGPPLCFQWLRNGLPLADDNRINGTQTGILTISDVQMADAGQYSVAVSNRYGALTSSPAALRVVLAVGARILGGYDTVGDASGVRVVGSLAYVADLAAGVQILDVGNPTNVVLRGAYNTTGYAWDLDVVGDLLYVADLPSGLQVLKADAMSNVARLGGYNTSGNANDVKLRGNLAYIADGSEGLQVVDVSDPRNPVRLGGMVTGGYAFGVDVVGNYAYVANSHVGLHIFDVSNPSNVTLAGSFVTGDWAYNVQVVDGLAYVATYFAGLQILDVNNPASVTLAGSFMTWNYTYDVQVVGKLAFLADYWAGLTILDVSNPADIVWVGGCPTGERAYGIQVVGNRVYLANGTKGLQVLEVTPPAPRLNAPVVSNGMVRLQFDNPLPGAMVVLEASTGLSNWIPVFSNSVAVIDFSEPVSGQAQQFYRAAMPP